MLTMGTAAGDYLESQTFGPLRDLAGLIFHFWHVWRQSPNVGSGIPKGSTSRLATQGQEEYKSYPNPNLEV